MIVDCHIESIGYVELNDVQESVLSEASQAQY